jgi:uncharacterized repeat protein (TIGR03803 family)
MKTSLKNHLIKSSLKSVLAFVIMASASLVGAQTIQTICTFNITNGASPSGGLTLGKDGNFYGTTYSGTANPLVLNTYLNDEYYNTWGTVFKITTDGMLTTLYSFGTLIDANGLPADGCCPEAAPTLGNDGNFYGTTHGYDNFPIDGTVYKLTTNGMVTTLVSFYGSAERGPVAGLTLGNDGNFYGTTYAGGDNFFGSVFKVTTNGMVTSLVSFGLTNGAYPQAALTLGPDGNFYGVTTSGTFPDYSDCFGTVFKVTTNGTLTTLVYFDGTNNGADPIGGLTLGPDGNFYGTTSGGTDPFLGEFNYDGTVFKMTIDATGTNATLTTVVLNGDNSHPYGTLVLGKDGNFYGTSYDGGGLGSVFRVTPDLTVTNLAFFQGTDGASPQAGLALGNDGNFYGTTYAGGSSGCGTVFRLNMGPEIDTNFNPSASGIYDVAVQNNGTILAWDGSSVVRMDASGNPDVNFDNNAAATIAANLTDIFCMAVDSAHRVYVGGDVQPLGDWNCYGRLIRLNTNGILDQILGYDQPDFILDTDPGQINTISGGGNEIPINNGSGGVFSIGGCFNVVAWSSNYNVADIWILDSGASHWAWVDSRSVDYPGMAQNEYGNYGEGGEFSGTCGVFSILRTGAGTIVGGDVNSSYGDYGIVNANYDGNYNNLTFSGGADGPVLALAVDGGILVGGLFSTLGNEPSGSHNYLGRFNGDGTVDDTFHPSVNGPVNCILVQSDGKILVGEGYDYFGYGGSGLFRFNADGSLDNTFNIEVDGSVSKLVQQPDGKILVVGGFSVTDAFGHTYNNIFRFSP